MTEPAKYEHKDVNGLLTSAVRKTNNNQREFVEVIIDGAEYTAWEDHVGRIAETCLNGIVRGRARRKEGSQYWTLTAIDPVEVPAGAHSVAGVASAPGVDPGIEVRTQCAQLAIRALAGREEVANATAVITYATTLECYILDLTSKPNASA